jgi:hypothetical protein
MEFGDTRALEALDSQSAHRPGMAGRQIGRPAFSVTLSLKGDTEGKLNPAGAGKAVRRNELRVDHPKSAGIGDVERRIEKIRVIKDIETIERKFRFYRFGDRRGFSEAQIKIPEAEALQRIVASVVGVGCNQSGTELGDRGGRIAEIVQAGSSAGR